MNKDVHEIFMACKKRDLKIAKLSLKYLRKNTRADKFHIATPSDNVAFFRKEFHNQAEIHDENNILPGVTIQAISRLPAPGFPQSAGWYYQQLLKYAWAFQESDHDDYLIWDADTILLQPISFYTDSGKVIFTRAEEYHAPYFETYRNLLREEAVVDCSFISQHQVINRNRLKEMLQVIEANWSTYWPWAIMNALPASGQNLFSEYETYGHFMKNHYPDEFVFRDLRWEREGAARFGYPPSESLLSKLSHHYDFVAFEASRTLLRRIGRWVKGCF